VEVHAVPVVVVALLAEAEVEAAQVLDVGQVAQD
jgi:hypothetical protein